MSSALIREASEWKDELEIGEELLKAIKRSLKDNTTLGRLKKVRTLAFNVLAEHLRQLFNSCLKRGLFPPAWRGQVGPSPQRRERCEIPLGL